MNSTIDSKTSKKGVLFSTLTALKTNILTFYYKVCSSLAQDRTDNVFSG